MGATAGHEAEHATNLQNINDRVENNDLPANQQHDVESEPTRIGNQIREEAKNELKPLERKDAVIILN